MRGWPGVVVAALAVLVGGCRLSPKDAPPFEPYLVVWAADADRKDSDFLAIINANPRSFKYGKLLATVPVKTRGNVPFGASPGSRADGRFFTTGIGSGRIFTFDLKDPEKPVLVRAAEPNPDRGLTAPYGVMSLANGNVLVTCPDRIRYRGDPREVLGAPGGFIEVDRRGVVVREISAGDRTSRGFIIAPSGIARASRGGVFLTTSHAHGYATTTQGTLVQGITVQIWSDKGPKLTKTIALEAGPRGEENIGPLTPRFLHRRDSVYVNTHEGSALYLSDSVATRDPAFRLVFDFGAGALPVGAAITPDDRWYVTALYGRNRVAVLDLRDPLKPVGASFARMDQDPDDTARPRAGKPGLLAMSADGQRVAVANDVADVKTWTLEGDHRIHVLRLETDSGRITVDRDFRDEVSDTVGVDFSRTTWPHGKTGAARPRALAFVAPAAAD